MLDPRTEMFVIHRFRCTSLEMNLKYQFIWKWITFVSKECSQLPDSRLNFAVFKFHLFNYKLKKYSFSCKKSGDLIPVSKFSVYILTFSWWKSLLYKTSLLSKSVDWFLYGRNLRHESVKKAAFWKILDTS